MNIDGHCLCGKVGFSLRSEANWPCYCHCEDCRRNCAAPIVAFFGISLEDFSWRIEGGAQEPKFFPSSSGVKRFFCDKCGTPMAFQAAHYKGEIALYAATLTEPSVFQPKFHVHHKSSLSWLAIDDNFPKFQENAPITKIPRSKEI